MTPFDELTDSTTYKNLPVLQSSALVPGPLSLPTCYLPAVPTVTSTGR